MWNFTNSLPTLFFFGTSYLFLYVLASFLDSLVKKNGICKWYVSWVTILRFVWRFVALIIEKNHFEWSHGILKLVFGFFTDYFKTDGEYQGDGDVFEEDVVDSDMVKKDKQPTAPSSMVLFYTWMIVAILIMVVSVSTYQTRCKGIRASIWLNIFRDKGNMISFLCRVLLLFYLGYLVFSDILLFPVSFLLE